MSTTLEHIRQEIEALPTAEKFSLWRDLGHELDTLADDDQSSHDSAWDAEIASRAENVKSGTTPLISGSEFELRTRMLFSELGIKRDPRLIQSA